jgi:predicted nucleic acid-binding protein
VAGALSGRWLFDTSIYIRILRDEAFAHGFRPRYLRDVARTHFSSVVIEELLAGARTAQHRVHAEKLFMPFERARRIVTPSHAIWKDAGDLMARSLRSAPSDRPKVGPAVLNDALIAFSARSIGATVVTLNGEDFRRIHRFRTFGLEILSG